MEKLLNKISDVNDKLADICYNLLEKPFEKILDKSEGISIRMEQKRNDKITKYWDSMSPLIEKLKKLPNVGLNENLKTATLEIFGIINNKKYPLAEVRDEYYFIYREADPGWHPGLQNLYFDLLDREQIEAVAPVKNILIKEGYKPFHEAGW